MPDVETGGCLGSEGNGVSVGKGARVGPPHQKGEKISSQCPTKADNMGEDKKNHPSRM